MTPPPSALPPNERTTLLDQVFRRISKLDDRALLAVAKFTQDAEQGNLPAARPSTLFTPPPPPMRTPPAAAPSRVNNAEREHISRRSFLAGLLAGSATTFCAGGAIGLSVYQPSVQRWLAAQGILPQPTSTTIPSPTPLPTLPTDIVDRLAFLEQLVTDLTAERDTLAMRISDLELALNNANTELTRLQGDLDAANAQITQLQSDLDGANAQVTQLQGDLERVTTDLQTARNRLTELEGLTAVIPLYQALEAANLDGTVKSGIEQTNTAMTALNTVRTPVEAGHQTVDAALASAEQDMPSINAGLDWLDREIAALAAGYRAFQTSLIAAQGSATGTAITQFANDTVASLPFTVGQEPRVALQTMAALVARLPELLDNVDTLALTPMREWIVPSAAQGGLYTLLFNPLREQLLSPVEQMVNDAQNVDLIYNSALTQPTQRVLEQRELVRAEINKIEQPTGASN